MDESDLAWKVATAALKSLADTGALDSALSELKPSAKDIARAYGLCLTTSPFAQTEATRLVLNARLQVALVQEHVTAQERMGRMINVLTWVLVVMTTALVIFGGIDFWQKWRGYR